MIDFPQTVAVPPTSAYSPPAMNFSDIARLFTDYQQGGLNQQYQQLNQQQIEQNQQRAALAQAFAGGIPTSPDGSPNYQAIVATLMQKGDIAAAAQFAPLLSQQQQAGITSPLLGGSAGGPASPQGGVPAAAGPGGPPPQATPATVRGGDQPGSIVALVDTRLPENNPQTGVVIGKLAQTLGIDPNATLTPGQAKRAQVLLDRLVPPQQASTASPGGGGPASLAPSGGAGQGEEAATRVAEGFSALPPSAGAVQPAPTPTGTQGPQRGAPQLAQAQPPTATGGTLVPQYALPVDPQTKKQVQSPQDAVVLYDREIARMSREIAKAGGNPASDPQIRLLEAERQRFEAMATPQKVGPYDTYVDPRTGQPVYQGPMANQIQSGATLDSDAERYRQTGTLPPNMGRGVQGAAQATQIRQRAVQLEQEAGGNPADWPSRWQDYRAQGIGKSAEARTLANREANLKVILRVTDAAVPAALEASEKVSRTGFVPLNRIIQAGQVMTSDPDLRAFGMANLQLAEGWAKAMNPTGVMRVEDRNLALNFLSTADSAATYRRLVMQLQKQINRELKAVEAGRAPDRTHGPPQPGVLDIAEGGSSKGGEESGWTTMPSGVRIRQVQ